MECAGKCSEADSRKAAHQHILGVFICMKTENRNELIQEDNNEKNYDSNELIEEDSNEENYHSNELIEEDNNEDNYDREEIKRIAYRKQRMQEMKRRKRQQEQIRRLFIPCAVVLAVCILLIGRGIGSLVRKHGAENQNVISDAQEPASEIETESQTDGAGEQADSNKTDKPSYDRTINIAGCYIGGTASASIASELEYVSTLCIRTLGGKSNLAPLNAKTDETTVPVSSEVVSENAVFIDVAEEKIMAQRDANARISPASMTKILTVLVAAEHITDPDDTFEITIDITDYSYVNGCSNTGFEVGEKVTVRDLFYGTILPSGADAALGLAVYVSGSQEAFVELMNEKLDELGLSETSHLTNCVGLYDENHYSTVYDMSVILKAAYDNSFCREVLSEHTYTTSATEQHPEGITLSNWFLRRIEDKETNGEVLCAKTGYVAQSGSCAASLSIGNDGKEYICVTAHSSGTWRCIYDQVALCQQLIAN